MMASSVSLISPSRISPNPENPRLIFREEELLSLEKSIKKQGILVPLTVYTDDDRNFVLLDGERRWRCAKKLNLRQVPAIIQPKPGPLQNIMMMFAIHKARSDWDPLPTAIKLQVLEQQLSEGGTAPTESALAAAASLTRGEVRRYKRILELPERHKKRLMDELEKPRDQQILTVDHVLESVRGANALLGREIITEAERDSLSDRLIDNFEKKIETKTVAPRLLAKLARSVEREEVKKSDVRRAALQIIAGDLLVEDAFQRVGEEANSSRNIYVLTSRLITNISMFKDQDFDLTDEAVNALKELKKVINTLLRDER